MNQLVNNIFNILVKYLNEKESNRNNFILWYKAITNGGNLYPFWEIEVFRYSAKKNSISYHAYLKDDDAEELIKILNKLLKNLVRQRKMNNINFPIFWFESNQYFNWVESLEQLDKIFDIYYKDYLHDDKYWILDRAKNFGSVDKEKPNFGLRMEHHDGTVTLREYLNSKGIYFDKNKLRNLKLKNIIEPDEDI